MTGVGDAAPNRALRVLAISGVLGFSVGLMGLPHWQDAVEPAQVVAHLVAYPARTPFYIYQTKLWTVLHQASAVLLIAGLSEIAVSHLLSGLMVMLSLQALAMVSYALSGDAVLAVGSAVAISVARAAPGTVYPISLVGTSATYGAIGLALIVLVVGLLSAGCRRAGAFLLGLAPAVHPSLGIWLGLIVLICLAWDFKRTCAAHRHALKYFLAGLTLTIASLILQFTLTYDAPPIEPGLAARYLDAFVTLWDGHRQAVGLAAPGVFINLAALGMALTWLHGFRGRLPEAAGFLLRFVAVSAILSVAFVFLSWIPPDRMPSIFLILMPSRILNLNVFMFAALLLGLIGAYRAERWSPLLGLFLLAGLLFSRTSLFWLALEQMTGREIGDLVDPLWILTIAAAALLLLATITRPGTEDAQGATGRGRPALLVMRRVQTVSICALIASCAVALTLTHSTESVFRDRTNDPFFAQVARGRGLLLTGGSLQMVQLRTRRPVLLEVGGLDALPYALESGPEMERILRDVYGIDLFHPPEEARGTGVVPDDFNRAVWQRYSLQRWQAIRRTYGVTEVLTDADWVLALPTIAADPELRLYGIPE